MNRELDVDTLTAVFDGVEPSHLREALRSLATQTHPARQCLVVADGPLTSGLDAVLDEMDAYLPLRVVRQERRLGGGPAKQLGLQESNATYVAIADADDISRTDRLEKQLRLVSETGASLVGAAMEEFDDVTGETRGLRAFPTDHQELIRLLRRYSPLNHPTVVLRRDLALVAGGYVDLPYLEDYDLWARMLAAGAVLANSPDPLVRFRGGAATLRRRRARGVTGSEWRLQRNLMSYGQISRSRAVTNFVMRTGFRYLPVPLMDYWYRRKFLTDSETGSRSRGSWHARTQSTPTAKADSRSWRE